MWSLLFCLLGCRSLVCLAAVLWSAWLPFSGLLNLVPAGLLGSLLLGCRSCWSAWAPVLFSGLGLASADS